MLKIFLTSLITLTCTAALAGGASVHTCSLEKVSLTVDGRQADLVGLTIGMTAQLQLIAKAPELADPQVRATAPCYNAFEKNDWNRFICIVGYQAVLVRIDANDSCVIEPASSRN